jgi:hypothetical protein
MSRKAIVKLQAVNKPDPQMVAAAIAPLISSRLKDEREQQRSTVNEIRKPPGRA